MPKPTSNEASPASQATNQSSLIKLNRKLETTTKIIHNETVNHLRSLGDILITEPSGSF